MVTLYFLSLENVSASKFNREEKRTFWGWRYKTRELLLSEIIFVW